MEGVSNLMHSQINPRGIYCNLITFRLRTDDSHFYEIFNISLFSTWTKMFNLKKKIIIFLVTIEYFIVSYFFVIVILDQLRCQFHVHPA
jgi:hypothetical protein